MPVTVNLSPDSSLEKVDVKMNLSTVNFATLRKGTNPVTFKSRKKKPRFLITSPSSFIQDKEFLSIQSNLAKSFLKGKE
jgi:hypothetical protein